LMSGRRCLYEVLDVERDATPKDIKKAYRKMALRWHPDKNQDNLEESEEKFKEIQQAYDILSDPQERSWYNGHREAFLRGQSAGQNQEGSEETGFDAFEELDVRQYMTSGAFKGFGSGHGSFFDVFAQLFERIAEIERREANIEIKETKTVAIPTFGGPQTDIIETKRFYDFWGGLKTRRSFSFCDKWRLSEAPSRKIRRLMEQENKKMRSKGRREYLDAIRELVSFVRKKDPRWAKYREDKMKARQKRELEKKLEKEAEAKKRKEARARGKIEEQQRMNEVLEERRKRYGDVDPVEDDDTQTEIKIFECFLCKKSFKSQNQWKNHEKSKKHKQKVSKAKKQAAKKNAAASSTDDSLMEQLDDLFR